MSTLQKSSQRSGSFHYTWNKIPTYKLHLYCPFQSYKGIRVTAIDGRFSDGDNTDSIHSDFRKRDLANQKHQIHILMTVVLASLVF